MSDNKTTAASGGISLGSAIAVVLSWQLNHSVWWMILHGFLGWLYIIYLCMGFGGGFPA